MLVGPMGFRREVSLEDVQRFLSRSEGGLGLSPNFLKLRPYFRDSLKRRRRSCPPSSDREPFPAFKRNASSSVTTPSCDAGTNGLTLPAKCYADNPSTNASADTSNYALMEFNFSMFWGIAVQMYESLLRADPTRFEQFMGGNPTALSGLTIPGLTLLGDATGSLAIFQGQGKCIACHSGPELTNASV